jgi:hypothetical protein
MCFYFSLSGGEIRSGPAMQKSKRRLRHQPRPIFVCSARRMSFFASFSGAMLFVQNFKVRPESTISPSSPGIMVGWGNLGLCLMA